MIILVIEISLILVLILILSAVVIDERKERARRLRAVKLRGYWNGKDRRTEERMNVSLEVEYYTNGIRLDAKSVDISPRGIRLLLDERIEKGTPIRLGIRLPDKSPIIKASGEVVWTDESKETEEASSKRYFSTGIRLFKFRNNDGKRLFDFICSQQA